MPERRLGAPVIRPSVRHRCALLAAIILGMPAMTSAGQANEIGREIDAILEAGNYQRTWPGEFPVPSRKSVTLPNLNPRPQHPGFPESLPPSAPDRTDTDREAGSGAQDSAWKPVWKLILGTVLVAGVAMLAFRLARHWRRRKSASADPAAVPSTVRRPQPAAPAPVTDELDRLAENGEFGEAVHLILARFIEALRRRGAERFSPALTSREILSRISLPGDTHRQFAFIIAAVEQGHFGGREIDAATYEKCLTGLRHLTAGRKAADDE